MVSSSKKVTQEEKPRLEQAYGCEGSVLDIISIPGLPLLHPHYELRDHREWLKTRLANHFPRASSWWFKYDIGRVILQPCWAQIRDFALDLLFALRDRRQQAPSLQHPPLLFLCQSFGAIILKHALAVAIGQEDFRDVIDQTSGIFFLACLHDEKQESFKDQFMRCAIVELGLTRIRRHTVEEALKAASDWQTVTDVLWNFRELSVSFPIRTYCEGQPTRYYQSRLGSSLRPSKEAVLCPLHDAILPNETVTCVDTDHLHLTSGYPARDDLFYETLITDMKKVVDALHPSTTSSIYQSPAASTLSLQSAGSFAITLNLAHMPMPSDHNTTLDIVRQKARLPCYVYKPYVENTDFVGRKMIVHHLCTKLLPAAAHLVRSDSMRVFAMVGLGGMGKTQTALHFMFKHLSKFQAVFWASADSSTKLTESFVNFAVELGLAADNTTDQQAAIDSVKSWLNVVDISWLLVFDNADGEDAKALLDDFWPTCTNGSILITSRNRTFLNQFDGVLLDELDKDDAKTLLLTLSKPNAASVYDASEEDAAVRLLGKIGRIPIVVHQAARLVLNSGDTLADFEEVYDLRAIMEDDQHTTFVRSAVVYPYNLPTVWALSFARLNQHQLTLINIMAFMDPDLIPRKLLDQLVDTSIIDKQTRPAKAIAWSRARTGLFENTLIEKNEARGEWRMHRVVQTYCYHRMQSQERQYAFDAAFDMLNQTWPVTPTDNRHDKSLWPAQQMCLKHIQSLSRRYEESKERGQVLTLEGYNFTGLLQHAAWYMYERGMIDQAYPLLNSAEAILVLNPEPKADDTLAAIYNARASLESESNLFEETLRDFSAQKDCIERLIKFDLIGQNDLREVFAVSGYANGLCGINNYKEAEKCYKQAQRLYVSGGFLKPLHEISVAQSNLATCLWLQGDLTEAEDLLRSIIFDRADASSYRTAKSLFALGNVEWSQGEELVNAGAHSDGQKKLQQSYETHLQSLQLFTAVFGPSHHKTGHAMYKVACHEYRRRLFPLSKQLLDQTIAIFEKSKYLRNEMARSMFKLGCVLQDGGELRKGREQIQAADKIRASILGTRYVASDDERDYDKMVMFWSR